MKAGEGLHRGNMEAGDSIFSLQGLKYLLPLHPYFYIDHSFSYYSLNVAQGVKDW